MSEDTIILTCGAGTTPLLEFTLTDASGTAVNLTGATATFSFAPAWDATATFSVTCTVTDAANGVCTAQVTATGTATPGRYVSELWLSQDGGNLVSQRIGTIIVQRVLKT